MINFAAIDTVLLDMDGTLLDLHFDARFWGHFLPERLADARGVDIEVARGELHGHFEAQRHRLEFYCTDWWSEATGLDLKALKRELAHLIRFRPNAEAFLRAVRASGRRALIVTNAHRDVFDLKHARTGVGDLVDVVESAHDHALPKEDGRFWELIIERHDLDGERTLLVDDNLHALEAAGATGIAELLAVLRPDLEGPDVDTTPYRALEDFAQLHAAVEDAEALQ